jgi:uncharacterized membrane protein YhhN
MRKSIWVISFLIILFADLFAIYSDNETMEMVCKSLLMPVLFGFFIEQTRRVSSLIKAWIILALFFSWVGDILLTFEEDQPKFFLFGLAAFFLAQVFYIIFFHRIRVRESISGNALLLLLVVVYYGILISLISPGFERAEFRSLKLPVRIYGVVISFMLMLAMHITLSKYKKAGWLMTIGAMLFVSSDSLLAINKFYLSIEYSSIAIMLTYGLAQLFIVYGAIEYINSAGLTNANNAQSPLQDLSEN